MGRWLLPINWILIMICMWLPGWWWLLCLARCARNICLSFLNGCTLRRWLHLNGAQFSQIISMITHAITTWSPPMVGLQHSMHLLCFVHHYIAHTKCSPNLEPHITWSNPVSKFINSIWCDFNAGTSYIVHWTNDKKIRILCFGFSYPHTRFLNCLHRRCRRCYCCSYSHYACMCIARS